MIASNKQSVHGKLRRAQETINLFVLFDEIYKIEKIGQYYYSPVRNDGRYPAFEIREDGQVGIDHATGKGFNAITIIESLEKLSRREATTRLIYYAENCDTIHEAGCKTLPDTAPAAVAELVSFSWPFLEIGSGDDYTTFAQLRGLDPMTLITATALELFQFFTDHKSGQRLCTLTDSARYVRQDRSVTGEDVALSMGGAAKTRTIGKAAWPVGAADIGSKPVVLLTEGMPDLLAAIQVISVEGRDDDTAAVAVLGAGQRIHAQALPLFAGKRVRVFPDNDPAGLKAGDIWQRQLEGVGAVVDLFSLEQQERSGLKPIKDLNDFVVGRGLGDGTCVIPTFEKTGVA